MFGGWHTRSMMPFMCNLSWWPTIFGYHYEKIKRGVLQLALQLSFWVVMTTCNSPYFYTLSVIKQVAWVVQLQLIIYVVQLIATRLQLCRNHSFSTIMQLHYNYSHNVMLTLLIFIHTLKLDMWHYEDFWIFFWNIDFHHLLWLLRVLWHVA
jgi:hypothetical protein